MGWYAAKVLPTLLDWFMDRGVLAEHRRSQLAQVQGKVLEIGFGTGVNIPYYPDSVQTLTTVDRNPAMNPRAQERISRSPMMVEHWVLSAESLPMIDNTFDTVVSTMTLCSIKNVSQAVREIFRVLKPGGQFLFLEHGLSSEPVIQRWQRRLTPISKLLGDGCHLNRDIALLFKEQRYILESVQRFYLDQTPKVAGYMYMGMAR